MPEASRYLRPPYSRWWQLFSSSGLFRAWTSWLRPPRFPVAASWGAFVVAESSRFLVATRLGAETYNPYVFAHSSSHSRSEPLMRFLPAVGLIASISLARAETDRDPHDPAVHRTLRKRSLLDPPRNRFRRARAAVLEKWKRFLARGTATGLVHHRLIA